MPTHLVRGIQHECYRSGRAFGPVQVFGYLHTAWTEIGFTHGDLNCANVMEHRGDADEDADLYHVRGFADSDDKNNQKPLFKLPGMPALPDCTSLLTQACSKDVLYQ